MCQLRSLEGSRELRDVHGVGPLFRVVGNSQLFALLLEFVSSNWHCALLELDSVRFNIVLLEQVFEIAVHGLEGIERRQKKE